MKLPLPPARSLGNKLALVFFAVIALAFSVIFFFVVPQLQSNLEHQRVTELRRVVPVFSSQFQAVLTSHQTGHKIDEFVRSVGDSSDAEVTVFQHPELWLTYDSRVNAEVRVPTPSHMPAGHSRPRRSGPDTSRPGWRASPATARRRPRYRFVGRDRSGPSRWSCTRGSWATCRTRCR